MPFSEQSDKCSAHKMPFSGHIIKKFRRPTILQLNIKGLKASKMMVLQELEVLVIVLQETHCTTTKKLVIANFERAGPSLSKKHGLATLVNEQLKWTLRSQSPPSSNTEWLCMDVDLPVFPHPSVYTDNFKSPHTDWGYNTNSADRDFLVTWANFNNLPSFIIQRKQPVSIPVAAILA